MYEHDKTGCKHVPPSKQPLKFQSGYFLKKPRSLKQILKAMEKKHLLVPNHSFSGTCQTNTCLTGHCCKLHSDTLLLALPVSRKFTGNGTFQEKKELKLKDMETNCKVKNFRDLYWSIQDFKNGYQTIFTGVVCPGVQKEFLFPDDINIFRDMNFPHDS